MIHYLIRRLLYSVLTLIGITIVVFVLIHAIPGDPVHYHLGIAGSPRGIPPEIVEGLRRDLGLDRPLPLQYLEWMKSVVRGDLGLSFRDRQPVLQKILQKAPATIELNLVALLLAGIIGIPLGVMAGAKPGRHLDRISGLGAFFLFALPNFWIALVLMHLFAVRLEILPLYGMHSSGAFRLSPSARFLDHLQHLILPAVVLSYAQIAVFLRFTRSAVSETIGRDFIAAARARGVPESSIIFRHALRNALVPLITLLGLAVPYLISGSVIVEQIFEWDGLGRLYFSAILSRDYPLIMGLTLLTATVVVLASLLTDLLYGLADPRIRLGEEIVN
jgi:peptide/nickel transport system permease protein